jgi:hypothetical protein
MPVKLTPSSLSSSVFYFHIERRYLKLVRQDWSVPSMVALRTFRNNVEVESVARTTTSERLQNW